MTAKEAYTGIRKIEEHYGQRFRPLDLHPIWKGLLDQPYAALAHAIGEMQMIWKRMPAAREMFEAVRGWSQRLDLAVMENQLTEGEALFSLTLGFLESKISEPEFIKGLYAMSAKYGNPEYAEDAGRREANLKG